MAGRRSRALAWAALALAAAGCEPDPEPLLGATCAPNAAMDQVTCTIRNHGKKGSRACFRARLQPPEAGSPIVARRVCTKVIEPGQSVEATALFDQIGRVTPAELLARHCVADGRWTCKVDVVETSREMTEDLPRQR